MRPRVLLTGALLGLFLWACIGLIGYAIVTAT